MSREAYLDSAEFFAGVVDKIDIDGWEDHAMGEWTVRDLAGHTYRSLTTILSYSSPPADAVEVETAVDFVVRATTGPNTDPRRVAELGRAAGLEIIDGPQMMVRGFFNFVREKAERPGRRHDNEVAAGRDTALRVPEGTHHGDGNSHP